MHPGINIDIKLRPARLGMIFFLTGCTKLPCTSPSHILYCIISPIDELQVDIIEVISDALYSDSEIVIDAAAELLDTLLKKNAEDMATMESLSLVSTFMQNASASATNLLQTEEAMKLKEAERDAILVELVSAVSLQRFRFDTGMLHTQIRFTCGGKFTIHKLGNCLNPHLSLFALHLQRAQQRADALQGLHPPLLWPLKVPSNLGRWADLRMVCWSYCSREQPILLSMCVVFVWKLSHHSLHQDPIIQIVCCQCYSREPSSPPFSAATIPTPVGARPILISTSTPVSEKIY